MKKGILAAAIVVCCGSVALANLYQEKSKVASPPTLENVLQRLDKIEQRLDGMDKLLRTINENTLKLLEVERGTVLKDDEQSIEKGMKADELERNAKAFKKR